MRKLECMYLDALSLPGLLMSKENNAKYHLSHICPRCPRERKKLRQIDGIDECWWKHNWENGNFGISKNFGWRNYLRQYFSSFQE
ncbi:MAG TPA: hypothetical protein VJ485_04280 [archaeon]|jgi:hypothetical protein|nr:hypothetical protein [archaeon]